MTAVGEDIRAGRPASAGGAAGGTASAGGPVGFCATGAGAAVAAVTVSWGLPGFAGETAGSSRRPGNDSKTERKNDGRNMIGKRLDPAKNLEGLTLGCLGKGLAGGGIVRTVEPAVALHDDGIHPSARGWLALAVILDGRQVFIDESIK